MTHRQQRLGGTSNWHHGSQNLKNLEIPELGSIDAPGSADIISAVVTDKQQNKLGVMTMKPMKATKKTNRRADEYLQFVQAYKKTNELASKLRAAEAELQRCTEQLTECWPEGLLNDQILTSLGTITRAKKTSFSIMADDATLVAFAATHNLKTSPARGETVAVATLRAAASRGVDVSTVCHVSTTDVFSVQ